MTRTQSEVRLVLELAHAGFNSCEISRRTGIPRATVVNWRQGRLPGLGNSRVTGRDACLRCGGYRLHPFPPITDYSYAYLLGIYLGDGCLLKCRRVHRLYIPLDERYRVLVDEVTTAAALVMPSSKAAVRHHPRDRYFEVTSHSGHWTCLFPQHGPGRKHERKIELASWQREIVDQHPWRLLRGLIHSDGSRSMNTIRHPKRTYSYPRYTFTNHSADIRNLFCEYCDRVGVEWRQMNRWNISVARRDSVALMDRYIGPKR
jgi:hypothetical protein